MSPQEVLAFLKMAVYYRNWDTVESTIDKLEEGYGVVRVESGSLEEIVTTIAVESGCETIGDVILPWDGTIGNS